MSYPSNTPGAYPYHAAGAAAALAPVAGGYSTSPDNGGPSNGAKDGVMSYSPGGGYCSTGNGNDNGYVEFVPRTYQHHGLVSAVNNPYPSHPQQEYRTTIPPALVPNPTYERSEEMYAASVPQQQHDMQQQSPGSMAPQAIHPAPTQDQRTASVVPTLPGPEEGPQQAQYQRIARFVGPPPVALACTECRARHLKCDAGVPSCNRCQTDGRECSYVKSRRGWKGTRRKKAAAAAAAKGEEEEEEKARPGTEVGNPSEMKDVTSPIAGKFSFFSLPFLASILFTIADHSLVWFSFILPRPPTPISIFNFPIDALFFVSFFLSFFFVCLFVVLFPFNFPAVRHGCCFGGGYYYYFFDFRGVGARRFVAFPNGSPFGREPGPRGLDSGTCKDVPVGRVG